jgi:membrane fusion protein (multidrug efflux system)
MYVRTIVQEGVVDQAILVPQQSVARNPKGDPFVLLVGADGKVEQRMIKVDRAISDRWRVASGLTPGDRVIVEGIQKVGPGVSVKPIPFNPGGKGSPEAAKPGQPATGAK